MSYADHMRRARRLDQPRKLVCYYAHPMSLYGTVQETRDIVLIQSLGFEVLNPNRPEHDLASSHHSRKMDYYERLVATADLLAFRALPDGAITAGVANEIKHAKLVIEIPSGISRRTLTIQQTLETLAELGER